jgi:hypothetical protein
MSTVVQHLSLMPEELRATQINKNVQTNQTKQIKLIMTEK